MVINIKNFIGGKIEHTEKPTLSRSILCFDCKNFSASQKDKREQWDRGRNTRKEQGMIQHIHSMQKEPLTCEALIYAFKDQFWLPNHDTN